jgi:CheY-like chemotaxis protein
MRAQHLSSRFLFCIWAGRRSWSSGDTDLPAGRRILIVEDLPENAEIIQDLLELEAQRPNTQKNGQVALELFAQKPPRYYDAILMDLRMPVMDGLDATRHIRAMDREDAKAVPIIALTANAFESDVQQSLKAGMNAHLAKPADADRLYETLRRLIDNAPETERRTSTVIRSNRFSAPGSYLSWMIRRSTGMRSVSFWRMITKSSMQKTAEKHWNR